MKVELKDLDKPFTKLRLTKFDDGLIRGGAVGALNAAAVDTLRIGKFLTDLPKGPLFLIKQVGLQLSNPRLEAKKGATGFLSGVGPTRIYNLGINTIAQVPLNAFGGHLVRHGLLPVMNDNTKYLSVVSENNKWGVDNLGSQNNRLVGLRNKFNLGDNETEISVTLQEATATNRQNNRDGREANREANKIGRKINRLNNKYERQFNNDLNKLRRQFNRIDNREGRQFNKAINKIGRENNRNINKQGRQDNRSVNQNTREGAKIEGFEFTRSKFERSTYERSSFERTEFERSKFERSSFHRSSFKRNKINISDYAIDSYLGGPGSVYGIGRTTINRYNFTEDKIKIDEAFENANWATIFGSISVNPLKEPSEYVDVSGKHITGAITVPHIQIPNGNNLEDNQFKVLGRKKQPESFKYNVDVAESKLQKAIGDGNIDIDPHFLSWGFDKSFGTGHKPQINPSVETPSDKFNAIKNALDFDPKKNQFKYKDEDPIYIGGTRIISVKQAGGDEINITGNDATGVTGLQTIQTKAKNQAEADKKSLSDYSNPGTQLSTVTVGRDTKRGPKTVKASIVNVENFERENQLRKIYDAQEMTSDPKTKINHKTAGKNFITQKVDINRDPINPFTQERTPHYFNGLNKVNRFDRVDRDIMLVTFDPIDPFTAKDLGTIVFSAYMSGFKYNSNSTWNPIKYVGRSESFYTFTEHKRDVSFNLQIPCFNRVHLLEKHRALSELQSVGAGTYGSPGTPGKFNLPNAAKIAAGLAVGGGFGAGIVSALTGGAFVGGTPGNGNRLGGIITKITLGQYLVAEPGILTSVSFDIPDTSSWDLDEKLAMYINAQFNFTIIGNALPTYREGGFFSYLDNPIGGRGFLTGSEAR
jgi:hypothetical protein